MRREIKQRAHAKMSNFANYRKTKLLLPNEAESLRMFAHVLILSTPLMTQLRIDSVLVQKFLSKLKVKSY